MSRFCWYLSTPIGWLTLVEENDRLTHLHFGQQAMGETPCRETPLMKEAQTQLTAYFAGNLRQFDLPLAPAGTDFQRRCWDALLQIPYGQTRTYGQQAQCIGQPKAVRAVGMANHRNPLPILIPCHRVVGQNGSLTGYAGGLDTKAFLLRLERSTEQSNPSLSIEGADPL